MQAEKTHPDRLVPGAWYRLRNGDVEYDVRVVPRNGPVVIVMDRETFRRWQGTPIAKEP